MSSASNVKRSFDDRADREGIPEFEEALERLEEKQQRGETDADKERRFTDLSVKRRFTRIAEVGAKLYECGYYKWNELLTPEEYEYWQEKELKNSPPEQHDRIRAKWSLERAENELEYFQEYVWTTDPEQRQRDREAEANRRKEAYWKKVDEHYAEYGIKIIWHEDKTGNGSLWSEAIALNERGARLLADHTPIQPLWLNTNNNKKNNDKDNNGAASAVVLGSQI